MKIFLEGSWHLKFVSCLLIFLPIAMATGPFLPDLFLSIIGCYFIFVTFKYGLFNYYENLFVYIFFLFYFYLLIRGLLSDYPYESLIKYNSYIFYFRYLFFILGLQYLLKEIKFY